jgi:hypothetical protein
MDLHKTNTKWLVHGWNSFGARTNHGQHGHTRLTTAQTWGKPPPSPLWYTLHLSKGPTFKWLFVPGLQLKVLQLCTNHLVWVVCRPVWVSEACQLFLVPSRSSNTPLYPSKCCELGSVPWLFLLPLSFTWTHIWVLQGIGSASQCVHFMPFSIYYSYISLHSYIDLQFKCETLKTFSKLQLIFGCKIDL